LVLAGAGSGKTRVLVHRVVNLVLEHGVRPDQVLAVTFTNKATEEMQARLHKLLGEQASRLWVSTFHSAALRILRRHAPLLSYANGFAVYDEDDTKSLLKQIIRERSIDEKKYPPGFFSRAIDRAKNAFVLPEEMLKNAKGAEGALIAEVYEHYQRELARLNAMDFGDLLVNVVRLFSQSPDTLQAYQHHVHYVLVDEFQDTNRVQYLFLRHLTALHRNLLVVGDDDQSIYAFRGADIGNILDFERDFPDTRVVKLEQNYRSTANNLGAAQAVIEKNTARKKKKLWTEGAAGAKVRTFVAGDETDEAAFIAREIQQLRRGGIALRDIAIFYRTNAQSRAIEEALMNEDIPYRIYGGLRFYDRKEIKDILAYLRVVVNGDDDYAFMRSVNTPPRGIGAQTLQSLAQEAKTRGQSLFKTVQALVAEGQRSKGLEQYAAIITTLRAESEHAPLGELINRAIKLSEYETRLGAIKDPAAQSRIENLRELEALGSTLEITAEHPLETLRGFLDRVSLSSSAELPVEESRDKAAHRTSDTVSLMTLHLAKGLEFKAVFLTGVEEGLLPHYRSIEDPVAVQEERRLCYVGMTRAMEMLYMTRATTRGLFSAGEGFGTQGFYRKPSRFAADIPNALLEHLGIAFNSSVAETLGVSGSAAGSYDDDDIDDSEDEYGSRRKKNIEYRGPRSAPSRIPRVDPRLLVQSADTLGPPKKKPVSDAHAGPLAEPAALQPGVKVNHPSFGSGVIEAIDGDPAGPPERLRLSVRFEKESAPKKLVYKFAKLSLE
jgi:DNA helicase-2/ATP-dependent DNA helicase PcrA